MKTQLLRRSDSASDFGRDIEIDGSRNRALLNFGAENIQNMAPQTLGELQKLLQHGEKLGVWTTPENWVTPQWRRGALLSIDLRRRIVHFLPAHLHAQVSPTFPPNDSSLSAMLAETVSLLTRYLILLRIGPVGLGKGGQRSLDPSTLIQIAYHPGPAICALAIARSVNQTGQPITPHASLSKVHIEDLAHLSRFQRTFLLEEARRMAILCDRGLWNEVPGLVSDNASAIISGERRHTEEPLKSSPHLPLPDEYASAIGRRSLWILRALGPNLLAIGSAMAELWKTTHDANWVGQTLGEKRREGISKILGRHKWIDHQGLHFNSPPFAIHLPKPGVFQSLAEPAMQSGEARWPPKTYTEIIALLGNLQMAHYFIVSLSMGARSSEVLGLQRNCLEQSADGRTYAKGRTYKLVQRHDGECRDWLLPDAAIDALEQQIRLVNIVERIAVISSRTPTASGTSRNLWAQVSAGVQSDATKPMINSNKALQKYAKSLGLEEMPGGQPLRPHRLRKTLARLVALALTQAPMILMEIFGHKTIEMTLYYILTDKELRAEIETVSRELRVMRAKEVIERMVASDLSTLATDGNDLGGYGGLAAVFMRNAIDTHRDRLHRRGEQWSANNVLELAELLTLQGTAWEQVRRGVICTKFPGEAGPCNRSKGRPEPSQCQSTCGHRLEEAFLREDVDESISDAVAAYEAAISDEELLTSAHWAGQIRAHVLRFPDLKAKWMLNTTVRSLLEHQIAPQA